MAVYYFGRFCRNGRKFGLSKLQGYLHEVNPAIAVVVRTFCVRTRVEKNLEHEERNGTRNYQDETSDETYARKDQVHDDEDLDEVKEQILKASLNHVPNLGWTSKAISAGAESLGFAGTSHGLFTRGGVDLINYFQKTCNQELEKHLQLTSENRLGISSKNLPSYLKTSIVTRLEMITPYKDRWPQALAVMALPQNVPDGVKNLTDLVNIILFYAGDASVDMRWYTKRLSLGAVYKSTELCFIQDTSPHYEDTWRFLDNRINDYASGEDCINRLKESRSVASSVFEGGFITVSNVLGLNVV